MTILNVNYRQFEEYHFVFAYKKQPMLLRYANQNCFILYFFWSCSPMQCHCIHLSKDEKIVLLISNYFYRHQRCRIFV